MEVVGALAIFKRSEDLHNVRYVKYLGDGDSKAILAVNAACPYGDFVEITKEECIGHVQKRMNGCQAKKVEESKGTKLCDGKCLSGRRRLTDTCIDKIQTYYGLAIRRNIGDLESMRKAV